MFFSKENLHTRVCFFFKRKEGKKNKKNLEQAFNLNFKIKARCKKKK